MRIPARLSLLSSVICPPSAQDSAWFTFVIDPDLSGRAPVRSRPTLSDVAKLCGVTPATVSRVLNKKRGFSTSPEMRQKILDAAEQLGYVPDLAARSLSGQAARI